MKRGFEGGKTCGGAQKYSSLPFAMLGWLEDAPTKVEHTQREMELAINRILPSYGKKGMSWQYNQGQQLISEFERVCENGF